ncbi:MAG: hypothetical protein AAGA54_25860 [Myxococcota bacterium]
MGWGLRTGTVLWVGLALVGCSDGGSSAVFDSNSASGSAGETGPGSGAPTDGDDSGPGSSSPSGGAGSAEDSGADESSTGDDIDIKLDVGSPEGGFGSCECELTYLWVADAQQGTVSKINTRTMVEEGRYLTRADGTGNPSRTSVNLSGDVAVANRHGGLTKFYANPDNCQDTNGIPGIQTSTGPDDVLPWDQEECRAWFADFPVTNQRPVAWTGDTTAPGNCDASVAQVWTVASTVPGLFPGTGGAGGVTAYLVDGETGMIDEQVDIPDFPGGSFGAYGGAVDGAGNLYFSPLGGLGAALLARVDRDTLDYTIWEIPAGIAPYGITVDHKGRVWLASTFGSIAGRFDPGTETWGVVEGLGGGSGLAEGPNDLMYVSQGDNVLAVQIDDLSVQGTWTTDETVKGVSFDADGFLWAVTQRDDEDPNSSAAAFKIDVETMTTDGVFTGLQDPYTYSDMTGNALGSVACTPAG